MTVQVLQYFVNKNFIHLFIDTLILKASVATSHLALVLPV